MTLDELLAARRFHEALERIDDLDDRDAPGTDGADAVCRARAFLAAAGAGGSERAVVAAERAVADGDDVAPLVVPLVVRVLQRHGRHGRAVALLDDALDQWPTHEQLTVAAAQLHGLDPADPLPLMTTRRGWEAEIVWRDEGGAAGERALRDLPLGDGLLARHDWWSAQLVVAACRRAADDHATAASTLELVVEEWPDGDAAVELAMRAAFDRCLAGHLLIAADSLADVRGRAEALPGHRDVQVVASAVLARLPTDGIRLVAGRSGDATGPDPSIAAVLDDPPAREATAAARLRSRAVGAGLVVARVGIDAAVVEAALDAGATVVATASPWGAVCPVRRCEARTGLVVIDRATSMAPFAGPLPVALAELSGAGAELVVIGGDGSRPGPWLARDTPAQVDRAELAVHRRDPDPAVAASAVAAALEVAPAHPAVLRAEGALLAARVRLGEVEPGRAVETAGEWMERVGASAGRPVWARVIHGEILAAAGRPTEAVAVWSLGWPPPEAAPALARPMARAFDELGVGGRAARLRSRADLLSIPAAGDDHAPALVVVG